MPEHYRALFFILALATAVFAFAKGPITAVAMSTEDFTRRRNAWYAITIIGFLSPHFWVFVAIVSVFLYFAAKHEHNPVALFFFVFLALPQILVRIPGFAGIESFVAIDYVRILTVFVLLPACVKLRKEAQGQPGGWGATDILLTLYVGLTLVLQALDNSLTGSVRNLIYVFVDILIPYYAVSRALKNLKIFRETVASLVVAIMVLSLIGLFELVRSWLPYTSLQAAWGVDWDLGGYLARGGLLRASATTGQAIALGYVIAIGLGFYLYLRKSITHWAAWGVGLALLMAGEIAPLSKGPWLGVVAMVFVFVASGPKRWSAAGKISLLMPFVVLFMISTEMGQQMTSFLPFVGKLDESSQDYRTRLFDTAIEIILNNPFLGSHDYLLYMENMRQGQGIIDLVNTFLIVALNTGLIGLALFCGVFSMTLIGIFRLMRRLPNDSELHVLGRSLLAVLIGILLIITTVSPIAQIPLLYWMVAAMGVAYYTKMTNMTTDTQQTTSTGKTARAWIRNQ